MGHHSRVRYFRSNPDVYADIGTQLDAAYGYPNASGLTLRALPLASELPIDDQGRVYLAIRQEFCEYDLPSELLPQLLAAGVVEELTSEQWDDLFPNEYRASP